MEGAASIHGGINEAAPSELWEKASFAPTNEPSLAYLEFLWNQYTLSDFWLLHVQQRSCRAWGMMGFFFKHQTEITRKHSSSKEKIEKNKEIITCPMREPFARTKTAVCARHGRRSLKQNHMAVAYFPWYFTRRPAWKPRPRRGSGFHAGSASEVSWKICNNKCGFVFIPRLYPWIYQATHITHLDGLPKYDFEPCRLQVFKQM